MSRRFTHITSPFETPAKDGQKFYQNLSILVVEDTPFVASLIHGILKNLGVGNIFPAGNATQAMSILSQHTVHAAIINDLEPPLDGLSFVRAIRSATEKLPQALPIILVTARPQLHYITQARDAGVTEILSKPFSAAQLQARIDVSVKNPRPFVQGGGFVGPDRRRRISQNISGKRATDAGHPSNS